jgi:hypothetical protein
VGEWSPIQKLTACVLGATLFTIPFKAGLSAVSGSFNDPCIQVITDATSVLYSGPLLNGKTQSEFSGTAWECVASTAQGVASTVQYFAGSAVESFNQGEPQRALGDFVSASKGLAQEAHLAFNQHLQSTLAGLQQRQ